ncbi:MAG: hypothetical protein WBE48_15710 [Xanthobacteraceae bacterium]|jgi:hypothetical protein
MARNSKHNVTEVDLDGMMLLQGPPPLLRTEDPQHYDAMFVQFIDCLEPEDFFELLQVREMVNAGWHIKRYTRHKTLTVERCYKQSLEFLAQRTRSQNAKREALIKDQTEAAAQIPQDIAGAVRLEEKSLDVVRDVDEILARAPSELDHTRALEKSLGTEEQYEKLIAAETAKFHKAYELFSHYRQVLAPELRKRAQQIVEDAEYSVVDEEVPQIEAPASASKKAH